MSSAFLGGTPFCEVPLNWWFSLVIVGSEPLLLVESKWKPLFKLQTNCWGVGSLLVVREDQKERHHFEGRLVFLATMF